MIETGRLAPPPLPPSPHALQVPMDDYDTISNYYYDVSDAASDSVSELTEAGFCEIANPLPAAPTPTDSITPRDNASCSPVRPRAETLPRRPWDSHMAVVMNPLGGNAEEENRLRAGLDRLRTGDVILCHSSKEDSPVDKAIECFTHSPWEHAAIVVRDPSWLDNRLEDGLYVFQAGPGPNAYPDVLTGEAHGVTLNRMDDFLRNREKIYARTLENFRSTGAAKFMFRTAFEIAHGKPYDNKPRHWAAACVGSFARCPCLSRRLLPREDNEFWCSALVYFMYTKMEWTSPKTDWSCKVPADLITVELEQPYALSEIWQLK